MWKKEAFINKPLACLDNTEKEMTEQHNIKGSTYAIINSPSYMSMPFSPLASLGD